MKHRCRHHRRGFMLIMAVTLLILIGTTLAVLATLFAAEARRTQNHAIDAQLRQLLIAGTVAARHGIREIALPAELPDTKVTITSEGDNATVHATLRGRTATEKLTFSGSGSQRKLIAAELQEF